MELKGHYVMRKAFSALKIAGVVTCSLTFVSQSVFAADEQQGGVSDGYYEAVEASIDELLTQRKRSAYSSVDGEVKTVRSIEVSSTDVTDFEQVKLFVQIKDGEGEHVEGLTTSDLKLSVKHPYDGTSVGTAVTPTSVEELGAVESRADIVFILDSTGSMGGEIGVVINNIIAFVNQLESDKVDYRLAGFHYGDETPYRGRIAFTSDSNAFKSWVSGLRASGGNDWPENPLDSVIASGAMDYRDDAQNIVVLITDAPAHVAGDGGDSNTSATFSAADRALNGLSFFYSSPESQYAALGSSLGWPFQSSTLLSKLGESITGKYIVAFDDPSGKRDGLTRNLVLKSSTSSDVQDSASYTPSEVTGTLTGKITNNDPVPLELADAQISAVNDETDERVIASTKSDGTFEIELGEGDWTLTITKEPDYAPMSEAVAVSVEDESASLAPTTLDVQLALSTVEDEKARMRKLANEASKFGTWVQKPFADEASDVLSWLDEIPDTADGDSGPSAAQREGLKRLIAAHLVLNESNQQVIQDAQTISSSVVDVTVAVLDLSGVFNKLSNSMVSLASKLDTDGAGWFKAKTLGLVKKILTGTAAKLDKWKVKLINTVLDTVDWALSDYSSAGPIITIIKDTISASSGDDNSYKGVVSEIVKNMVAAPLSRNVVVPVYANAVEPTIDTVLSRSRSISTADVDAMNAALLAANTQLKAIQAEFANLERNLDTVDSVKRTIGLVKGVIETLGELDKAMAVVEKVPVATPYVAPIRRAIIVAPSVLTGLEGVTGVAKGGLAGVHLYGLSDDTALGMMYAYGGSSKKASAIRRASAAKYAVVPYAIDTSAYDLLNNAIQSMLTALDNKQLETFVDLYDSELLGAIDSYLEQQEVEKAKVTAGDKLATSTKPINYDLLATQARDDYQSLLETSMSVSTGLSGLMLSELIVREEFDDSAESLANREQLAQLLYVLQDVVAASYTSMDNALSTVESNLGPVVNISSLTSNVSSLSDDSESFEVIATVTNSGATDSGQVTLKLIPPKEIVSGGDSEFETADLVTVVTPEQSLASVPADSSQTLSWTVSLADGKSIRSQNYMFQVESVEAEAGTHLVGSSALILPAAPLDSDGDGLPNEWEIKHGLNIDDATDATSDKDGDKLSNLVEYEVGLNPSLTDSNGDGIEDLVIYLKLFSKDGAMAGDLNEDDLINQADLDLAVLAWGKEYSSAEFDSRADINGDGQIDIRDLMQIDLYSK